MHRALLVSVLICGSEAWSPTLADGRRLDEFDNRCQWRLLCVFSQQHIINRSILVRTKKPTASSLLRQRRLRWFGYLFRLQSSLPIGPTKGYDFNTNIRCWKRPRGRPKSRWADSIKHDLHSPGLSTPTMLPGCSLTDPSRN